MTDLQTIQRMIAIGLGAVPATVLGLFAAFLALPGGAFGAVGLYGFGVEEQLAGVVLLIWGSLGVFGVASLWLAVLYPSQRRLLKAVGLVAGIIAMVGFLHMFAVDLGTLRLSWVNSWFTAGPILVALYYLLTWGWQWIRE